MKITTKKLTAKEMVDMNIKRYFYVNPAVLKIGAGFIVFVFGLYVGNAFIHIQNTLQESANIIQQWNASIPN